MTIRNRFRERDSSVNLRARESVHFGIVVFTSALQIRVLAEFREGNKRMPPGLAELNNITAERSGRLE
jgi:hypothetical protein